MFWSASAEGPSRRWRGASPLNAGHIPRYRQTRIFGRQGVDLDRPTISGWGGRAAFELRPVFDALVTDPKRSTKLSMDETRAPVLEPGSRKTRTGEIWAPARDGAPLRRHRFKPNGKRLGAATRRPAWHLPMPLAGAGSMRNG